MTKQKLLLVKVGGKVVENPVALNQLISDLSKLEGRKVMVHGGGVLATKTEGAEEHKSKRKPPPEASKPLWWKAVASPTIR